MSDNGFRFVLENVGYHHKAVEISALASGRGSGVLRVDGREVSMSASELRKLEAMAGAAAACVEADNRADGVAS